MMQLTSYCMLTQPSKWGWVKIFLFLFVCISTQDRTGIIYLEGRGTNHCTILTLFIVCYSFSILIIGKSYIVKSERNRTSISDFGDHCIEPLYDTLFTIHISKFYYKRRDLNSHSRGHTILSGACLPFHHACQGINKYLSVCCICIALCYSFT